MKTVTDKGQIEDFLTRGVENVFPSRAFLEARLKQGKPLTMYLGIDPTGPTLHLGHAIVLRKLQAWQGLGHKVILLIGDFTGMIGDPTDKSAARKRLTREEVLKNAKQYKQQAGKIIRFDGPNAAELKYNSEWLGKLTFTEIIELAAHLTVPQLMARDMFRRRTDEGKDIFLHEFLYPLMQGFDSVAMNVDGEIGGNDQMFNMLVGRDLMKDLKGKEKFVLTMKLLVDPSGKKMGKTEGNMITFEDSADDMFGKVMSWTDGMIVPGFELLTDVSTDEMKTMEKDMKKGANPKDFKIRLAKEVVAEFFDVETADAAEERFASLFKKHETPEEMPTLKASVSMTLLDALVSAKLVASKSEARRQIEQGGVKVNGGVVKDINAKVSVGAVIQKGKRHFVRLVKG
jgi:tyrosyl-tRNA synthetase